MHLPKDLGTWGFILSIVAIVLMYPVGLLINMTTPVVQNWIATTTQQSLINRIARLEKQLEELEKVPALDEVQNQILFRLNSLRAAVFGAIGMMTALLYLGVSILAPPGERVEVF